MLLFERCLQAEAGIIDEKVQTKRQQRAALLIDEMQARGQSSNPLVQQCTRATQRSLQFIRWLRHCLAIPTSYTDGLTLLRPLMQEYLT